MFGRKVSRFNGYSWLALGIGAITGAAVALLFAPTTGKKLQQQLKDVLEDGVENVQNVMKRVVA